MSCRPARLVRFEGNAIASIEGLSERMRALLLALDQYVASCDPAYVVPACREVVDALREWRGDFETFARWTGDVGRSVAAVDAVDLFTDLGGMSGGDEDSVAVVDAWRLLGALGERRSGDLLLGVPYRPTGYPRLSDNGDGPPKWLTSVKKSGGYLTVASGLAKWAGEAMPNELHLSAALRVTRSTTATEDGAAFVRATTWAFAGELSVANAAGRATTLGRWLGRAGNSLAFAGGFASQWIADDGTATPARVLRATVRGGFGAGGALGGGELAAGYCMPAGPGAVFGCGVVGSVVGGVVGDRFASALIDRMPGGHRPDPGELDHDRLTDAIARPEDDQDTEHRVGVADLTGWKVAQRDPHADPNIRALAGKLTDTPLARAYVHAGGGQGPDASPADAYVQAVGGS